MDPLDRLKTVTMHAQVIEDLPDFLAARIFTIIELLRGVDILKEDVDELSEQVAQYDTFAQTGYIGMGVDNLILEGSIRRLEAKIKNLL